MWTQIRQAGTAPFRLIPLLVRIVRLLEEQNALLRELHLTLTGHHAFVPSRSRGATTRTDAPNVKSGADVWLRTPLSVGEQAQRALDAREQSASAPDAFSIVDGSPE